MAENINPPEEQPKAAPRRGRRAAALAIALVLIVGLAIGGLHLWRYFHSYESTDDAQIDGHLNMISSRIQGTVSAVYVTENQIVEKGQVLADLDREDYQVALERAEANLAQSQA